MAKATEDEKWPRPASYMYPSDDVPFYFHPKDSFFFSIASKNVVRFLRQQLGSLHAFAVSHEREHETLCMTENCAGMDHDYCGKSQGSDTGHVTWSKSPRCTVLAAPSTTSALAPIELDLDLYQRPVQSL